MMTQSLVSNLSIVREYFSHNIRTSTAMIVASVSIFKFGLDSENDDISEIIIESSYFLDVYDKAMEIMFNYVLDKPIRNDKEVFAPLKVIEVIIENLRKTIKEQGVDIVCEFNNDITMSETNGYVLKTLLEVVLCEEIKKSDSGLTIVTEDNVITIKKHMKSSCPDIYHLFADFFKKFNIEFDFDAENTILRFL